MNIFDKLKTTKLESSKDVDPLKIFDSQGSSGKIKEIWEHQADVLSQWHEKRKSTNISVELSTGRGKTVVGLLIAQSILLETKGYVLYVCPDNNLINQVTKTAKDINIPVSIRHSGEWTNHASFQRCDAICITNYDSVFNSKSVFNDFKIAGVVFDDGHVAHEKIRGQFTLKVKKNMEAYEQLIALFKDYFETNSQGHDINSLLEEDPLINLFVPFFEIVRFKSDIIRIISTEIPKNSELNFSAKYILNKIDRCTILLSASRIEITPFLIPIKDTPLFNDDVRKIFLTATLPSMSKLQRVFGIDRIERILPKRIAGEPQRLFIFAQEDDIDSQHKAIQDMLNDYKYCVLTPSIPKAKFWHNIDNLIQSDNFIKEIELFKNSSEPKKLVMAARYDGIDFADDICRILILDGLPKGEFLLERFLEENLRLDSVRTDNEATRIIQAIGRIFRNRTDRGVVVITGNDLIKWLRNPRNQELLPHQIQKQIQVGDQTISSRLNNAELKEIIGELLNNSELWNNYYQDTIGTIEEQGTFHTSKHTYYVKERKAFDALWSNNYPEAITNFMSLTNEPDLEEQARAWFLSLTALCYQLNGDNNRAAEYYWKAFCIKSELGHFNDTYYIQNIEINAEQFEGLKKTFKSSTIRSNILDNLANIKYGTAEDKNYLNVENSIRELGSLLGLTSTRQNKDNIGPDVIWYLESIREGVSFEVKSDKKTTAIYSKDDIGQCFNHSQWLKERFPHYKFIETIAGKSLQVDRHANPSEEIIVIPLEELKKLYNDILRAVNHFNPTGEQAIDDKKIQELAVSYGLTWPQCITRLKSKKLIDLQT